MYSVSYSPEGIPSSIRREINQVVSFITIGENADFRAFLEWNNEQPIPLDWHTPIVPTTPPPNPGFIEFNAPIKAPDFIAQTPKINDNPELALGEAIAEMEKGEGSPKSIALVSLSLAKYLKSKKVKLK